VLLLACAPLAGVSVLLGRASVARGVQAREAAQPSTQVARRPPAGAHAFTPARVHLRIGRRHLKRLAAARAEALDRRLVIPPSSKVYVPAELTSEGRPVPVDVRLKGDWLDHVRGGLVSLRVRTEGGHTVLGMRRFSLQDPARRNHLGEWLLHRALRRAGLLAPRYEFVRVFVNEEEQGVAALEEFFDKQLLEDQGRREGPIVKLDESLFWRSLAAGAPREGIPLVRLQVAPSAGFGQGRLAADDPRRASLELARATFDAFRRGEASPAQAFDLPKLAEFLAWMQLLGAWHGLAENNLRFYFDPIAARFEPIGFDGGAGEALSTVAADPRVWSGGVWERVLTDQDFLRAYGAALERATAPEPLAGFLDAYRAPLAARAALLSREAHSVAGLEEALEGNRRRLEALIAPAGPLVQARRVRTPGGRVQLEAACLGELPVEVLGLRLGGAGAPLALPVGASRDRGIVLSAGHGRLPEARRLVFEPAGGAQEEPLALVCRVLGTRRTQDVVPVPPLPPSATPAGPLPEHPGWEVDEEARVVAWKAGTWRIEELLTVPPGYTVTAGPGTELRFARGGALLARSPLRFRGTLDDPVVVRAEEGGLGLALVDVEGLSRFRSCRFAGLAPALTEPHPAAGVTVVGSAVAFEECAFEEPRGHSALGLIHARASLEACSLVGPARLGLEARASLLRLSDVRLRGCEQEVAAEGSRVWAQGVAGWGQGR
jgi:hypothetical protein